MNKKNQLIAALLFTLGMSLMAACDSPKRTLPVYGNTDYREVNGTIDTIYHRIPEFRFVDQDSATITHESVAGKIYVADFFFGTCPTICIEMAAQMQRVYQNFKGVEDFAILSHTIDPDHDTVAYLKGYATRLGVADNKIWHFLTGNKEEIYKLGTADGYMMKISEDANAAGGFIHSGAFILIDKERRVRGVYDGTIAQKVDILMQDINTLRAEYED